MGANKNVILPSFTEGVSCEGILLSGCWTTNTVFTQWSIHSYLRQILYSAKLKIYKIQILFSAMAEEMFV